MRFCWCRDVDDTYQSQQDENNALEEPECVAAKHALLRPNTSADLTSDSWRKLFSTWEVVLLLLYGLFCKSKGENLEVR